MTKKYLKTPEQVVQALKEGKTVKSDYGYAYELKDNFIIQTFKEKIKSINTTIYFDEDYYIEKPEPLKLEVGKFYKTRSGKKAFVYTRSSSPYSYPFYVVIIGKIDTYCCTVDGKYSTNEESAKDLVAPWEE